MIIQIFTTEADPVRVPSWVVDIGILSPLGGFRRLP